MKQKIKKQKTKREKAGSLFFDSIGIIVLLFILAVSIFAIYFINEKMTNKLDPHLAEPSKGVSTVAFANTTAAIGAWDYLFAFIMGGLIIGSIISVFHISSHPVYFVIFIMVTILFLIIVPQFSNVFYQFSTSEAMAENTTSNFPVTTHIMDNYPLYIFFTLLLMGILLYAKYKFGIGE